jgi:hypothetical protein
MKLSKKSLWVIASAAVFLSIVLCFIVFGVGYGLGLERATSDSRNFSPEKSLVWQTSEYFFFLFKLTDGLVTGPFLFFLVFGIQVLFYAALMFSPFYIIYKKQAEPSGLDDLASLGG